MTNEQDKAKLLREVDALVARAEGKTILTRDEMVKEAEWVWQTMPSVTHFTKGYTAWRTEDGTIECRQLHDPCSKEWAAAGPLAEKHHLALIPLEDGRWASVPYGHVQLPYKGMVEVVIGLKPKTSPTPMLAICRAVLRKAKVPIPDHLLPLFEGRTVS